MVDLFEFHAARPGAGGGAVMPYVHEEIQHDFFRIHAVAGKEAGIAAERFIPSIEQRLEAFVVSIGTGFPQYVRCILHLSHNLK